MSNKRKILNFEEEQKSGYTLEEKNESMDNKKQKIEVKKQEEEKKINQDVYQTFLFINECPECNGKDLTKIENISTGKLYIYCNNIPKTTVKAMNAITPIVKKPKPGNVKVEMALKNVISNYLDENLCPFWSLKAFDACKSCGHFDKPPRKTRQTIATPRITKETITPTSISTPSKSPSIDSNVSFLDNNENSNGFGTPISHNYPSTTSTSISTATASTQQQNVPRIIETKDGKIYTKPLCQEVNDKKVFFCARPLNNEILKERYLQVIDEDYNNTCSKYFQIDPETSRKFQNAKSEIENSKLCSSVFEFDYFIDTK